MSAGSSHKISVGLPVYNGENYISEAIDSVLNQTLSDIELIISDNASTDQTREICQQYAQKDSRIRYYRNDQNLGVYRNYNRVFELSTGEYFKWAAHDDLIAPEFFEACLAPMERDSSIVAVYPKGKIVNRDGKIRADYGCKANPLSMNSSSPNVRLGEIIKLDTWFPLVGLFRSSILRKTPMFGIHFMADIVLLARISLMGRFLEIPDPVVFVRFHKQQSVRKYQHNQSGSVYYATAVADKIVFPRWKKLQAFFGLVMSSDLGTYEKIRCHGKIIRWFHWRSLLRDIGVAVSEIFRRCTARFRLEETKPIPHDR
jgi:glycosyltransferase involved in cell wall biosynthesis